jgi:hypothetical protein
MINVAFNGKKLFEWEGDADAVERIEDAVLKMAKIADVTPADASQAAMGEIARTGGFATSNPQAEMMVVLWTLISLPTKYPDHPGFIRDYIELWDFDFDISNDVNPRKFVINYNAKLGGVTVS